MRLFQSVLYMGLHIIPPPLLPRTLQITFKHHDRIPDSTPQKYSQKNLLTKKIPSAIVYLNLIPRRTAMTQFNNANKTDGLVLLHTER